MFYACAVNQSRTASVVLKATRNVYKDKFVPKKKKKDFFSHRLKLCKTHLSDGSLPLAAPALSAALLGFLLLLGLGYLLYVRNSILRLVLIYRRHAFISERRQCARTHTRTGAPPLQAEGRKQETAHWHDWHSSVHARTHTRAHTTRKPQKRRLKLVRFLCLKL